MVVHCGLVIEVSGDRSRHLSVMRLSQRLNLTVPPYPDVDVVGQIGTAVFRFCWWVVGNHTNVSGWKSSRVVVLFDRKRSRWVIWGVDRVYGYVFA